MSGGHFDYKQHAIEDIADAIDKLIASNDDDSPNIYGESVGQFFRPETIAEFKTATFYLRMARIYAHRIDWLVCGDDGEERFRDRLAADLKELFIGRIEE